MICVICRLEIGDEKICRYCGTRQPEIIISRDIVKEDLEIKKVVKKTKKHKRTKK